MESVQVANMQNVASAKVRVIRGVFYWGEGHSLDNFETQEYWTYKDAMLASLTKALEYFIRDLNDPKELMKDERKKSAAKAINEIYADVTKIEAGETPQYLCYCNRYSEYHMKIV